MPYIVKCKSPDHPRGVSVSAPLETRDGAEQYLQLCIKTAEQKKLRDHDYFVETFTPKQRG